MFRACVTVSIIFSVTTTSSQKIDQDWPNNEASSSVVRQQPFSLFRSRTNPRNSDMSWLAMTLLLFQENKKIADLLEDVKQVDKSVIDKIRQNLDALKEKFDNLPQSTRCYLGMKSGDIPDSAINASSSVDEYHAPHRARLDSIMTGDHFKGGWSAAVRGYQEWIEVDLMNNVSIAGVILQGRSDIDEWVKTYKVQCDSVTVQENYVDKIFTGNSDRNTKVVAKFPKPLTCQYIRILPESWEIHVSLRFELIRGSCFDEY